MFSNEAPQIHEEREAGQCFCHLLAGHPHASMNDMCDVCRTDYEEWAIRINQAAALAKFDAQWARLVARQEKFGSFESISRAAGLALKGVN